MKKPTQSQERGPFTKVAGHVSKDASPVGREKHTLGLTSIGAAKYSMTKRRLKSASMTNAAVLTAKGKAREKAYADKFASSLRSSRSESDVNALSARVHRTLVEAISRMDDKARRRAIASPTPAGTIAEIVRAAPDVGLPGESAQARALARGAALRQKLLLTAGGALTSGQVADILGISPQGVKSRAARGKLLSVPLSGGNWGFPALQFHGGDVRPGSPDVLSAAADREMGPWHLLSILLEPAPGGGTLLERIADDDVRAGLVARLRTYGEQQAA